MRRKAPRVIEPSAELRTFRPEAGMTVEQVWASFEDWRNRRVAYGKEHGWPDGMLVMLQQHMTVRRKLDSLTPG